MDDVPDGVGNGEEGTEEGPLEESDLPASGFTERLTVGRGDTILTGVNLPLLEVCGRRTVGRSVEYLVLAANYETFGVPRVEMMPEYEALITTYEQVQRKKLRLPELRRSSRLADANEEVEDDDLLMA
ncbi:hypothetical protein PF005_g20303 [Phytophthora fragariae]|uniref:Uncharacterized protein n=1 Tax=Phytophthora fragariae TaxID=53985 RepID=A0A6A4CH03_9STRA|nr:hypothetical protein PF003_g30537 [Phytophthora fragariae]KAE8928616.1 hypothetical protein PF009_g21255 [Phytophthora fragariae]KAE8988614.1 hypothetical protein PF011_g19103 [Phytophthora fragariae]KAE9088294.1 hypothetical protein PF007_g20030 [Phytophthora fragariae]KAE9088675.1 hypothetical protein PF010_g19298 [Phytophthora fragariae]